MLLPALTCPMRPFMIWILFTFLTLYILVMLKFCPDLLPSSLVFLEGSSPFSLCLVVSSSLLCSLHFSMSGTTRLRADCTVPIYRRGLSIQIFLPAAGGGGVLEPNPHLHLQQTLRNHCTCLETAVFQKLVSVQLCAPTGTNVPLWGLLPSCKCVVCLCVVPGLWASEDEGCVSITAGSLPRPVTSPATS